MKRKTTIYLALAGLALALSGFWLGQVLSSSGHKPAPRAGAAADAEKQVWTCSMHPQIRLDGPGKCPICEMPLIPAAAGAAGASGDTPMVQLSEHALAMAQVETTPVTRRALTRDLRAVGKIQYNESSLATVTARVDGYAERLYVNITGVEIRAGDHLADVYSPDFVVAQEELFAALRNDPTGKDTLIETAKLKLRRWALTDNQIAAMSASRNATDRVTLYSPIQGTVIEKSIVQDSSFKAGDVLYRIANLDTVWVYLDIYEVDLPSVRYGQVAEFVAEALPGRTFTGRVTFVEPIVNEETRTIRVPVVVDNRDHALKPGMFVSAAIRAAVGPDGNAAPTGAEGKYSCPMHPQVLQAAAGACPNCDMPLEQIARPSSIASPQPTYQCPMKCEKDKTYDQLGNCPVCNMQLKPLSTTKQPAYQCPMKCEGNKTYDQPGNCPVCNMLLKPLSTPTQPLAVPVTAVLDFGLRRLVYVETMRGHFEPRLLVLGPRARDLALPPQGPDFFPVLSGLTENERVVTRGGFLIDSQFQITGQASLFHAGGMRAATGGHDHGTAVSPLAESTAPPPAPPATPPVDHRQHNH